MMSCYTWPIVQNQYNALKKSYEGLKSEEAKKQKQTEIQDSLCTPYWNDLKLSNVTEAHGNFSMYYYTLYKLHDCFGEHIEKLNRLPQHDNDQCWIQLVQLPTGLLTHHSGNLHFITALHLQLVWGLKILTLGKVRTISKLFLLVRTTRVNDVKALVYFTYPPPKKDDLMEKWDGKSNGLKKNMILQITRKCQ